MAKNIKIEPSSFVGVNPSSRATFGLKVQDVIASVSEAIQRIFTKSSHKTLCHSELFDKANKRNIELCEPVPRVAESQVFKIPHQVRDDIESNLNIRKALAFTLAEVLVVLGIIGVVSALTLPNLGQNTGNKETVAKLQKVQSELNDALGRAQAEYGPVKTWFRGGNYEDAALRNRFNGRIEEFLRVSKICEANKSGCFTNKSPKNFRGAETATVWNINTADSKRYILADGTSVFFHVWSKTCSGFNAPDGSKSGCGLIEVDLDGPNKGPHQAGKDIFLFDISDTYGIYPFGSFQVAYDLDAIYKRCFNTGNGCAAWVINNGNLDYLKADANGKCPNGKVLSQTVTTCK